MKYFGIHGVNNPHQSMQYSHGAGHSACSRAYLENFHLAHSRLFTGWDMFRGGVADAAVQKVPSLPLSFLPVLLTLAMDEHRLLSEPNLRIL